MRRNAARTPTSEDSRGTLRALSVLDALNVRNGASVTELWHSTGISRPALYRILGTLVEAGYLRRRPDDARYFLTSQVERLSGGFKHEYWIAEIAAPTLEQLQRQVVWPTDLGICRNCEMHLVHTTRRQSPLVIDEGLVGVKLPLLRTALGLVYLAHCSASEWTTMLDYLAKAAKSEDAALARDRKKLGRLLADIRRRGYGYRHGNVVAGTTYRDLPSNNATISVPIMANKHAVAAIGITFIASAMSIASAATRHLAELKGAAARIERALA